MNTPDEPTEPIVLSEDLEAPLPGPMLELGVFSDTDKAALTFTAYEYGEVLSFHNDGKVYVRGELVNDNKAVYEAFCDWLTAAIGRDPRQGVESNESD